MHIAQLAPLAEAIPPKLYGGTERVVSWLTEELIALRSGVAASLATGRLGARPPRAAPADA